MRLLASASVVVVLLGAGSAAAATCLEDVKQLAETHRLSTDPPTVVPGEPGARSEELGRSKGVIEPPSTTSRSVIEPPRGVDPGMKTLPNVAPGAPDKGAVNRVTLQSVLAAARAQAERGEESRCREQLAKAHRLLEGSKL